MISLVPFAAEHIPSILSWFPTEAALVQWGGPGVRFPLDAAQLSAVMAEAPTRLAWTGLVDGEVAAHAQVVVDLAQGVARLARVGVAPERRGMRLAVPFLRAVLARIWAMPEIARVELNVRPGNAPAIATYTRLGFVQEGVRRAATRVGAERWDIAWFGLLRGEVEGEGEGEGFDVRPTGYELAADAYPLSPLEAWYVMRGYQVRPAGGGLTLERFLDLPGKLELADGYVLLWTA